MEATRDLLPYLSDLVVDQWAMGSFPDWIVEALMSLGLACKNTDVLDLGCGKGTVSIAVARTLGYKVVGIDCFEPFVDTAIQKAIDHHVNHLCRFKVGDIHDLVTAASAYDIVIYAGVGVWGPFDECVGKLRTTVRPGGYILVEDVYLNGTSKIDRAGYEHCISHEECIRQLTSHEDAILSKVFDQGTDAEDDEENTLIRERASQLATKHPETFDLLLWHVHDQQEECKILANRYVRAIWLIQNRPESVLSTT